MRHSWPLALAVLIPFVLSVLLSQHAEFWMDEAASVDIALGTPWHSYLTEGSQEGNGAPLFYLLLKVLMAIQPALASTLGVASEPILRLIAMVPMALTLGLFFEIGRRAAPGWRGRVLGGGALVAALGSYTFSEYSWQARHYGMWVLGSALQTWILLEWSPKQWKRLVAVHWFLSLTVTLSIVQIGVGIVYLAARSAWVRICAWSVPPILLTLYLQSHSPQDLGFRWPGLMAFRNLSMAHAKWWLVGGVLVVLAAHFRRRKMTRELSQLLGWLVASVCMTGALALMFWLRRHHVGKGFEIPNRYFIFLFPQLMVLLLIGVREWSRGWIVGAGLAAIGILGLPQTLERIWKDPLQYSRTQIGIAGPLAASGDRVVCLALAPDALRDPSQWVQFALEARKHNLKAVSGEPPVYLGLKPLIDRTEVFPVEASELKGLRLILGLSDACTSPLPT